MFHTQQHVRSTQPKGEYNSPPSPVPEPTFPEIENDTSISNEFHIKTAQISNLYTGDTGHFPVT